MAVGQLVRPSAGQPRASAQRLLLSAVAGLLLAAALIAVVLRTSEDNSRAELEAGKLELKGLGSSLKDILKPKGAELSFGDAAFHTAGLNPSAREGGVRAGGMKPSAPKGVPEHIAQVGLKAAKGQQLSEVPKDKLAKVQMEYKHPYGGMGLTGLENPAFSDANLEKSLGSLHPRKSSKLAFGDAIFNPSTVSPKDKEGGVRNGKTPKFAPPLGDLGEVGLAAKPKKAVTAKKTSALAFGDAAFHAGADPKSKEGSVRGVKGPDFKPPLGDLGEIGLAAKPKAATHSALKFGDSSFHAGSSAAQREGSVRNGQKPDFEPPIGDLGEVGLKPKIHAGQTLAAAKKAEEGKDAKSEGKKHVKGDGKATTHKANDDDDNKPDLTFGITTYKDGHPENNYPQEKLPATEADAKQAGGKMSAQAARKDMDSFFNHQNAAEVKAAVAAAGKMKKLGSKAEAEMHSYFESLNSKAQAEAKSAVAKHAALAAKVHKEAQSYYKAKVEKDSKAVLMAHPKVEVQDKDATAKKDSKAKAEMKAVGQRSKARLMELATGENLKYDKDHFNKHGFHPKQLSHDPQISKELKAARSIEKNDLDDCTFTLC